jgi:hypothetical protein
MTDVRRLFKRLWFVGELILIAAFFVGLIAAFFFMRPSGPPG